MYTAVEPICRVTQLVPLGRLDDAARERNPVSKCARAEHDAVLSVDIKWVW